ncbi:MAG: valine--tRNA ligase, partial [Rhodothermales bacterium]|nr:valine--tRNA ligase [Rhodothermales bacterium]
SDDFITVATTRPETMFGDSAVAVHPDDERYADLVGRKVRVPLTDRWIPVITDDYVKMEFGAGALKITPGHDKNDFEIGSRHDLDVISVINLDGTLNESAGSYADTDRFEARDTIVEDLEKEGLLLKTEPYKGTVPISSRSKAIIEPLISRQWFVRMKPLAKPALEAVRNGDVSFYPSRWENEYFRWLENIRDWTISRQLWWGHRIPVWYHLDENGEVDEGRDFVVSVEQPSPNMVQDEDVLDTWFSSWLWPFATLGWPDETPDIDYFYPTTVLVSGYDILFFWIARMIMAGIHFKGEPPFRDIFITGMVKDKQGRWMSKSLGNGIDPLDMIDEYGADAVRYSLTILCAQGQDIKLEPSKFEMGRNFANKIWNAFNVFGRFIEDGKSYERTRSNDELDLVEQWMLHRVNQTIEKVDEAVSRYRLNEALAYIYDVFWRDFCDWYLELIKPGGDEQMSDDSIALSIEIFETMLKLLHPFMPFITEELWWKTQARKDANALIVTGWPSADPANSNPEAAADFELIKDLITGIRTVRAQYNLAPRKTIDARINFHDESAESVTIVMENQPYFEALVWTRNLSAGTGIEKPSASASAVVGTTEIFLPLEGLVDLEVERARLRKDIEQKETFVTSIQKKLQNAQFVERAPKHIVEAERDKESEAVAELTLLRSNLENLGTDE